MMPLRDSLIEFGMFCKPILAHSHSQRLQDLWALWESGGRQRGYFVEFGALNGRDFSNTFLLERLGWAGVVAEPHPAYAVHLRRNRRCGISTKCVYDTTGEIVAFRAIVGRPALSTVGKDTPEDQNAALRTKYIEHSVQTITLTDLLVEHGSPTAIDFLSIDTEGSELRILRSFDFARFTIGCICVEHNVAMREALFSLLTAKGYRRKWELLSGHDDWYVHQDYRGDWDHPTLDWTASSGFAMLPKFEPNRDEKLSVRRQRS